MESQIHGTRFLTALSVELEGEAETLGAQIVDNFHRKKPDISVVAPSTMP